MAEFGPLRRVHVSPGEYKIETDPRYQKAYVNTVASEGGPQGDTVEMSFAYTTEPVAKRKRIVQKFTVVLDTEFVPEVIDALRTALEEAESNRRS